MVRSEQWYRKANQADNEVAKLELAKLWEDNNHQPFSDVINLLKEAAESGSADAMQKLGFIYLDGQKVPQNIELADRYLRRASTTNPALTFKVARQYEILAKQNKALVPQALDWMGDAAKQGNADALARLGRYARKGEWVKKDVNVARKFYQTAIKAGHEGARTELAKLEARDAQIRQKKALQRQEHEQKLAEARAQKKAQHDTGKQNTRASKDAAKMAAMKRKQFAELSEDAEKGDIAAMREVGRCYMQGKGVERDTDKGLAWLNKAAGVRDLEAMVDLASAYASGSGAAYDIVKAYEWYAKAAEAGSPIAQYQLGLGYARGIGVSENKALAKQWLEKARNNGYAPAASALETLDVNSAGNKQ
jgi:TPR repeat protein